MKTRRRGTLDEVLQSTADSLFPARMPDSQKKVKLNSRSCDGDTPLHILVLRGNLHGVKLLIEAGAKLNLSGDMGYTPLHVAMMNRNAELAEILVQAGARTDIRNEFGETAIDMAECKGCRECLKALRAWPRQPWNPEP